MGKIAGAIGGGLSLFKLRQATADSGDVLEGKLFFSKSKEMKTGTLSLSGNAGASDVLNGKTFYNTNAKSKITGTLSLSGNANAAQVLSGYTFYKTDPKSKVIGTMANRGSISATLSAGGSKSYSAGYYSGGTVTCSNSFQFAWAFMYHSDRKHYQLGLNSTYGSASGATWTCRVSGTYRLVLVCNDSIGNSNVGIKKNGSWLIKGMIINKSQDVSLSAGDTLQLIGGPMYGDPYGACTGLVIIWHA